MRTQRTIGTVSADAPLGDRAAWGQVGYVGDVYGPVRGTYAEIDALHLRYTTAADSGAFPSVGAEGAPLANLTPLVMMALNDLGFVREAGLLTTWNN